MDLTFTFLVPKILLNNVYSLALFSLACSADFLCPRLGGEEVGAEDKTESFEGIV